MGAAEPRFLSSIVSDRDKDLGRNPVVRPSFTYLCFFLSSSLSFAGAPTWYLVHRVDAIVLLTHGL